MRILIIPTTDWIYHPVPNRLNFIFDLLAKDHEIFVLHFKLRNFSTIPPRETRCVLVESGPIPVKDPSLYYILNAPFHLVTIRKLVREEKIDAIVSANVLPSFMAGFTDAPVIFDYLDHLEESASVYYPGSLIGNLVKFVVKKITLHNLQKARSIITVTGSFRNYLENQGFSPVYVIPNGVDSEALRPIPIEEAKKILSLKGPVIGYIGSLEYWVDLETVISSLPSLDVTLLVVGPGLFTDYGEKIKQMANENGVADRVIFTGSVPFKDLAVFISAMDIGLNPLKNMAKNEMTVGGKVFNYLSCGRPVLSSRMPAVEEMLGDALFYFDDKPSFVSQVNAILAKNHDSNSFRDLAVGYDWKNIAQAYEKIIQETVRDQESVTP
jgi:glycosyltransferase involved in cell wall biosynthesis